MIKTSLRGQSSWRVLALGVMLALSATHPARLLADAPQPAAQSEAGTAKTNLVDFDDEKAVRAFDASINYREGTIQLPGNIGTLTLPKGWRFIDADDAKRVIEQAWRNPDGSGTMGIIFPPEGGAVTDRYAVVVQYDDSGYVSDKDAKDINYTELLQSMQKATEEGNAERREQGFAPIHLVGWAEPPRYDAQGHKLYWAKMLQGDDKIKSLNYNIRILGRGGVLVLNVVGSPDELKQIHDVTPQILAATEFGAGNQYADYKPGVDKAAGYGLAGLIAGGIAVKTGLFAKIIAMLLAAKKLVIAGVVALGAFLRKLFGGKKGE